MKDITIRLTVSPGLAPVMGDRLATAGFHVTYPERDRIDATTYDPRVATALFVALNADLDAWFRELVKEPT